MRRFLFRCLAVLAMSAGSVALAGLGPNGLGPNGLGPNGLGPNGLGPNGLGPNGLGPNGLGPNGLGPNGLGPNGLGPNGLGPNGLDVNGLGPNGLGPNGLGPNGLPVQFFAVEPGYVLPRNPTSPSAFDSWFQADPASASKFMSYFARCAYDGNTGIAYLDAGGKTWAWTGQYGFAMTSLKTTIDHPALGTIRAPMTLDEGKWVSACLLAHVNLQGSHQYVSLRGSPPNPEAQSALMPGTNEIWVMGDYMFGAFFGDLFGGYDAAGNPVGSRGEKYACTQYGSAPWFAKADTVIGRNCDVEDCSYPDPANPSLSIPVLDHVGTCTLMGTGTPVAPDGTPLVIRFAGGSYSTVDPWWWYRFSHVRIGSSDASLSESFHPLFVNGPRPVYLAPRSDGGYGATEAAATLDVAACSVDAGFLGTGPWCTAAEAPYTVPFDPAQVAVCGGTRDCFYGLDTDPQSYKLVGLRAGQAMDPTLRFTIHTAGYLGMPSYLPDMNEPFTAIVRYQKDRNGSAHVSTRAKDGTWQQVTAIGRKTGPDVWKPTEPGKWEWLQVYPTYLAFDPEVSALPGRFCSANVGCPDGYRCDAGASACVRVTPARTCTGATCGAEVPCATNERRVSVNRYQQAATTVDECVLQCTAESECGSGQACMSGRCVSPSLKIRLSGAAMSESCTGVELFKGPNEQGACTKTFKRWPPKHGAVCPREFEVTPQCRGKLTWTKRKGVWGWFCRGGDEALYACLPEDAPDLDAVAYIPAKPWCAKADATAFVGVCRDRAPHDEHDDDDDREENEVE